IYDGETFDARIQPANFAPAIAEPDLGTATLSPKPFPPVRHTDTLTTQNITQPQPGHYIFDLGQNMVGWARIHLPVKKDQTLTLHFAEMLNADGSLYNENYRTAKSTDTYTAATTGTIDWQPHFTFHGFRYVELDLPPGTTPQKDWVTGIVLHSDLPTTGLFSSSDPELNQLQSNILWGWRGNSVDIPTDCPQRDERAGWTGDAEIFCPTSMFNTDALAFWKSWLGSMRDDQTPDGIIPDVIPGAHIKYMKKSPGWMDAATIIPWDLYVRTGDKSVLADNYEMMANLVAWYRSQSENHLLPHIIGYGDWLQPYPKIKTDPKTKADARTGDTPFPLLGVAFYARSTQILADSARVLGKTDDAKKYSDEAAAIRAAFTREYFTANGKLQNAPETQTAYVLAIAFNLIPQDMKSKAADNLVRLVHDAGDHLGTGFLGTPFLCPALDQTGHPDLAAKLLFTQTYPSWFYPINQGATTMWERWNSYTKDKGFGDVSMNSFNHYAYGAIGQWMYERVAGLTPDPQNPGYKHFFIHPLFLNQLTSASATHETPYGKAASAWKKSINKIQLDLTIPPNTTATLQLPNQPDQTLAPGTHHLSVNQ
ncbi:MAG: family 78 glycoside hydrolase catalytic domain, partial [Phycisphaerae bacterium]